MERHLLTDLLEWLKSKSRKPMVLRGARQVGKTWLVRALAKKANYQLVEINFEKQRDYAIHFDSNDPATILLNLESALGKPISPEKTILFLDEIQAAPELLAKLRWFYESIPELAVIAAGSLLEFVLEAHAFSMPVGRIQYCFVEPLGFEEFLLARGEAPLLNAIKTFTFKKPLNSALHEKANALFKEYLTVGGMPEAVSNWIEKRSLETLSMTHHNLINTYKDDFSKYVGKLSTDSLEDTLTALPRLLSKKLVYSHINHEKNHASIKRAVSLLNKARLCHIVQSTYANGIPAGSEINPKRIKMILLDIGLASTLLGLNLYQFQSVDDIMLVNNGALAEQVVGQLLRLLNPYYIDPTLYYWVREMQTASAEIDYIIQDNQYLVPIEVKAGSEGKLRSLHQFMHEKPWKTAVRFYAGQASQSTINTKTATGKPVRYALYSLPFYLISQLYRLIELKAKQ